MKVFLLACATLALATASGAPPMTPWQDLYRVPVPEQLPPHPRLFCTPAELARIRADQARQDPYTVACIDRIVSDAEAALIDEIPVIEGQPPRSLLTQAAVLGQAYALTSDERFGQRARALLLAISQAVMPLKRTGAAGLMAAAPRRRPPGHRLRHGL